MKLGVVILAAGASSRMGRPKLLLPWVGTSVLGYLLRVWQEVGATQTAVVLDAANVLLAAELDRLGFAAENRITNPQPERGMFSSIQCTAKWHGWHDDITHWAITLGDQPHVRAETLRALIEFAARNPAAICQPSRNGRGRHPVVLPAPAFRRLANSTHENLRLFLRAAPEAVMFCESGDAGLDLDLDTVPDYERALREFGPECA